MKRTVMLKLEFDPTEYNEAVDTPEGAIDLALDMLNGEADLPDRVVISCDGAELTTNIHG